jgi:predicted SnoaL-like aldol condensation-catalyzing enzyme
MPSTTTMTPVEARDPTLEANREAAIDFLVRSSSGGAKAAMRQHASGEFVHHNPFFASDGATLAEAMEANARQNPAKVLEVKRSVAEGPFVVIHSRVRQRPEDRPIATVHIFRFEAGQIAELWDIAQAEPADTPNRAGMF